MAKYRKKPIEVEAYQWFSKLGTAACPGVIQAFDDVKMGLDEFYCDSMSGLIEVEEGDWIIKDVKDDKYYPCKPDIFKELFDEVPVSLIDEKDTKEFFPLQEYCPKCKTNYLVVNRKNQKWCSWKECGWGLKK
jgi:hypothetical protein